MESTTKNTPSVGPATVGIRVEWMIVALVLLVLAIGWTALGSAYYQRKTPFYDSLAYQEQFISTVERARAVGPWTAFKEVWLQRSNVVLFKFFAAGFGRLLPASIEGLYLYLFGIHFAGIAAVICVVYRSSGMQWLGLYAGAAWLACRPFKEGINGVLDQRMDLASGSFCLVVAALFLDWARRPSWHGALLAGLVAALAVLHRPVMALTIAGIAVIFIVRALLRHGTRARQRWNDLGVILLPGLILTLPWLIKHAEQLRFYYLIFNVDVGSASSMTQAAEFNLRWFGWSMDAIYALLVGMALIWGAITRRIDWLDFIAVLLCATLPLALLITSRSVGNVLVPQIALGLPALALACLRPIPDGRVSGRILPAVIAGTLLSFIGGRSLHQLAAQVAGVPPGPRAEVRQMLREFDRQAGDGPRIVTGFQSVPIDCVGLAALARQEGINFQAGPSYFHPTDFGVANDAASSVSEEQLRFQLFHILAALKAKSTFLLVVTADSENALPPAHFSQLKVREIRAAVEADHGWVRRYTTSAIQGIKFDVYVASP